MEEPIRATSPAGSEGRRLATERCTEEIILIVPVTKIATKELNEDGINAVCCEIGRVAVATCAGVGPAAAALGPVNGRIAESGYKIKLVNIVGADESGVVSPAVSGEGLAGIDAEVVVY